MSKEYKKLQRDEQRLLDKLQSNPFCKKIMSKLSNIQWKISLYEQEANEVSINLH